MNIRDESAGWIWVIFFCMLFVILFFAVSPIMAVYLLFILSFSDYHFLSMVLGALAGGYVGFLLRPMSALYGQLPFETVIVQGANLRGEFERLLIPLAQLSFNYMVAGAIIGAFIGLVTYRVLFRKR